LNVKRDVFYNEGGKTLEWVAHRSCECPITESVQGQAANGFEHPALVKDVPACCREAGLYDLERSLPTQTT